MANVQGIQTNWYTNSYGGPFRSSRLRAPSLLPGRVSGLQAPLVPVQQTLVVDGQRRNTANNETNNEDSKNVRRRETIFGPDVGEDDEPGWTKSDEGAKVDVNVVKGWVERAKSEEGLHATTTLQALVNLKRPTLLLQQLAPEQAVDISTDDGGEITSASARRPSSAAAPLHTLKFNYDATTPLVNISMLIYPTPPPLISPIDGKEAPSIVEEEPKTVYSGVHSGGFNQIFQLPFDSAIDLSSAIAPPSSQAGDSVANLSGEDDKVLQTNRGAMSEDTNRSSIEQSMGNLQVAGSTQPDLATVPEVGSANESTTERRPPRRFGIFPRRGNREADPEAGDIELQTREQPEEKVEEPKEPEQGMRILIKIEAIGPEGQALKRRNAQLTHILISGTWVADAAAASSGSPSGKRIWVVRVVRREAIIGAHTFLLKEIYGLSSSTQAQDAGASGSDDPYASTPNECIVCLTSPRDVVLLPCRHLVVCRDCAVGMVEFGAGGKVARREDTATEGEAAADTGAAPAAATGPAAPPVAGGTTTTGRERRKKKAKGWYCPVCRQPYTSLLRLALPASAKPLRTPAASRHQSRAPSIRSVRSTNTLHRAPSIAPTLPDGAENMLDRLRPAGADDSDDDENEVEVDPRHPERPQFVLGPDVDEDKAETEHREHAEASARREADQAEANGRTSIDSKREGKGWKEV